jgi:hypothetical protein
VYSGAVVAQSGTTNDPPAAQARCRKSVVLTCRSKRRIFGDGGSSESRGVAEVGGMLIRKDGGMGLLGRVKKRPGGAMVRYCPEYILASLTLSQRDRFLTGGPTSTKHVEFRKHPRITPSLRNTTLNSLLVSPLIPLGRVFWQPLKHSFITSQRHSHSLDEQREPSSCTVMHIICTPLSTADVYSYAVSARPRL